MLLPEPLRERAVVVVNERPASGRPPVGHVNLSFYWHGIYQGAFGQSPTGRDLSHRLHPQGIPSFDMPGGVFVEDDQNMHHHFVVMSDTNYIAIRTYAIHRAIATTMGATRYGIIGNNCGDFIREAFAASALPQKYKNVSLYLSDHSEPVAIYVDTETE